MNCFNVAHQISWRSPEVLSLPPVHVCPNRMPIGTMKLGINVGHGLDKIITWWQILEVCNWESTNTVINNDGCSWFPLLDIDTKVNGPSKPRFYVRLTADGEDHPPCDGFVS